MQARWILASVGLVVAALLGYHELVVEPELDQLRRDQARELALGEARLRAAQAAPAPALSGRELAVRSVELEKRVAKLEAEQEERATVPRAPSGATLPSDPDAVPPVIAAARERARQMRQKNDVAMYREQIQRVHPAVDETSLEEAAAILARYAQTLRDLYEGKEHVSAAERQTLRQRAGELVADTKGRLRGVLPDAVARRLIGAEAVSDDR